ncbi:MAG: RhuM family protein [Bacteroidia bacterium]
MIDTGHIEIYITPSGDANLEIRLSSETIWLTQHQMAQLFDRDRSVITKHINNVFKECELDEKSNVQILHISGSDKPVKFYSLDVVISVGYRVKSLRGTHFRIWATSVLKKHLTDGYTVREEQLKINYKKLRDLQQTIQLISKTSKNQNLSSDESKALIDVLSDYSLALEILDEYDHQRLSDRETTTDVSFIINYDEAKEAVEMLRKKFGASKWFGNEKDNSFKSSISTINQTFDGKELYPSIEEKAANLLYFVVKNHSFTDGNKRIAAWLFVWYLQKNGLLYNKQGYKRVADNALVALTLMIAESKQEEKDIMIKLVINLINKRN